MLVLTRKITEKIVLTVDNTAIEVFLVSIKGKQARLGIKAPKDVTIHRGEVQLLIDKNKESFQCQK